jgi:hypothetical protein
MMGDVAKWNSIGSHGLRLNHITSLNYSGPPGSIHARVRLSRNIPEPETVAEESRSPGPADSQGQDDVSSFVSPAYLASFSTVCPTSSATCCTFCKVDWAVDWARSTTVSRASPSI